MRTDVKCLVLLGGLVALGCNGPTEPLTQPVDLAPQLALVPPGHDVLVCKVGPPGSYTFTISATGGSLLLGSEFDVDAGQCVNPWEATSSDFVDLTVNEVDPSGLDSVEVSAQTSFVSITESEVTFQVSNYWGARVVYYNSGEGEGCTPGFWKTRPHQDLWPATGLSQSDDYDDVFGVNNLIGPSLTLLGAVSLGGNSYNSFIRHSVAALLNASHPGVAYDLSPSEVIAIVQAAHASGDFATAKNQFEGLNEQGCSIV